MQNTSQVQDRAGPSSDQRSKARDSPDGPSKRTRGSEMMRSASPVPPTRLAATTGSQVKAQLAPMATMPHDQSHWRPPPGLAPTITNDLEESRSAAGILRPQETPPGFPQSFRKLQVDLKGPNHFKVRPRLKVAFLRAWSFELEDSSEVLVAYLKYEHRRIATRMHVITTRYGRLKTSSFDMAKGWDAEWQEVSRLSTIACIHKVAWTVNCRWLVGAGLSNDTDWIKLGEELIRAMIKMLSAAYGALSRVYEKPPSPIGMTDFGGSAAPKAHRRLSEVRGDVPATSRTIFEEAVDRHRKKVGPGPPSPLRQERSQSPVSDREKYTFETMSEAEVDVLNMGEVFSRLAFTEISQGEEDHF